MQDLKKDKKRSISLDIARSRLARIFLILIVAGAVLFVVFRPFRSTTTLLNVSYDATRELYAELNAVYSQREDHDTEVKMSHAGSSKQARALLRGLMADVATLATAPDMDALSRAGFVSADWRDRFPNGASPYSSTIVFLVRGENPKQVQNWSDLARKDVVVVSPDPRVSGAGRVGYLAAWGAILEQNDDAREAERVTWEIYWKAELIRDGARGVLERFARVDTGDVLITWESEAYHAVEKYGKERFQIVYPRLCIQARPVVAVVDRYADRRGTRADAEAYLEFLFSPRAQEIAARYFFRPLGTVATELPDIPLFTVEEAFGSWETAFAKHFAKGGTFDRIAQLRKLQRAE
jgi:sulfate/thiosulfate-binding protein